VVSANAGSPISYHFNLTATNSVSTPGGFNTTHTGTLAPNSTQQFSITSPAGRLVYFDSLVQNNNNISYALTAPDSSYVTSGYFYYDNGPFVLPQDGTYTL